MPADKRFFALIANTGLLDDTLFERTNINYCLRRVVCTGDQKKIKFKIEVVQSARLTC
jgi:hypothetical protein